MQNSNENQNNILEVRDILFDQMRKLKSKDSNIEKEVKVMNAMVAASHQIIETGKLEFQVIKQTKVVTSNFFALPLGQIVEPKPKELGDGK